MWVLKTTQKNINNNKKCCDFHEKKCDASSQRYLKTKQKQDLKQKEKNQDKQSHRKRHPICDYGKGGGWGKTVKKYKLPVISNY